MDERRRVLVAFSDDSLGGTSRSALTMGRAWRLAGARVDFCALKGVHPDRVDDFHAVGEVVTGLDEVDASRYDLLHHHHGHLSDRDRLAVARWAAQVEDLSSPPPLLTHNVFGVADYPLGTWPGPVAVGLLGEWLVRQYRWSCWPRRSAPVVVVPNPQDFDFFRSPTAAERAEARVRFASGDRPLVLRVGSPHSGKWSRTYVDLDAALRARGMSLLCVGAPPDLAAVLERRGSARLLPPSNDADRLRDLYWAADVLAVDARQGESFGNVLLEALGCSTPVVYRDRPTRDNTPREFPVVLSRTSRAWIRDVLRTAERAGRTVENDGRLHRYSIDGVARVLGVLLDERLSPASLREVGRRPARAGLHDRLAVAMRHLPPGRTALRAARRFRAVVRRRPHTPSGARSA